MTLEDNIAKLKDARAKMAKVYEAEATDNHPDNGNLSQINNAILNLNQAIIELVKRLPPE